MQTREKQGKNGSRWREDKVGAITSYLPGNGTPDHPPQRRASVAPVSNRCPHVATMERTEAFGRVLRVEAERRGMRRAGTVLVMGDGGNWIDPLSKRECLYDQRIVDYHHAVGGMVKRSAAMLITAPEGHTGASGLGMPPGGTGSATE